MTFIKKVSTTVVVKGKLVEFRKRMEMKRDA